ncbi:hypothetical protein KBD18_01390 [Patescibacteria group bacterium]|nr:hypothetical protein [Patescibacteria group bacterium]
MVSPGVQGAAPPVPVDALLSPPVPVEVEPVLVVVPVLLLSLCPAVLRTHASMVNSKKRIDHFVTRLFSMTSFSLEVSVVSLSRCPGSKQRSHFLLDCQGFWLLLIYLLINGTFVINLQKCYILPIYE